MRLMLHLAIARCIPSAKLVIGSSRALRIPQAPVGANPVGVVTINLGFRSAGLAEVPPVAVYAPNCSISLVRRLMARKICTYKNTIQVVGI